MRPPFGFKTAADVDRVIAGIRDAERLNRANSIAPIIPTAPNPSAPIVSVYITRAKEVSDTPPEGGDYGSYDPPQGIAGYYGGRFNYYNSRHESPSTKWEDTVGEPCYVTVPNEETLIVGARYVGMITGDRNGVAVVVVIGFAETAAESPAACGMNCGWLAGHIWCLKLTVIAAYGEFSGISLTQVIFLELGVTSVATFNYGGGSGVVRIWLDGPIPHLSINSLELLFNCCGDNYVTFSGGPATGHDGGYGGTTPVICGPNYFVIKVECSPCAVDGWGGAGWYCIVDAGEVCGVDAPTIVYLEEGDEYTTAIVICSGPYATEAEAEAVCGPVILGCCSTERPTGIPVSNLECVVSTGDIFDLAYDGTYVYGSMNLSCGESLHIRLLASMCTAGYACTQPGPFLPAAGIGSAVCTPKFISPTYTADMNDGTVGCVAGSCGVVTFFVREK